MIELTNLEKEVLRDSLDWNLEHIHEWMDEYGNSPAHEHLKRKFKSDRAVISSITRKLNNDSAKKRPRAA